MFLFLFLFSLYKVTYPAASCLFFGKFLFLCNSPAVNDAIINYRLSVIDCIFELFKFLETYV